MKVISKLFGSSYVSLSDEELMELFNEGKIQAFEELYLRYKDKILSYAHFQVKRKALAEELTQDIFIHLDKKKSLFDQGQKFSPWFWRMAKNLIIDHQRKNDPLFSINTKIVNDEMPDEVEFIESEDLDPEMSSIESADKEVVEECINKLSNTQKEAFVLRIFSELNYDEISTELKKSVSGIKSLINRARTSVVECVKGILCGI